MTTVILFAIIAAIVFSMGYLLYLWERHRNRRHGPQRVQRTMKQSNVTSKRIAS